MIRIAVAAGFLAAGLAGAGVAQAAPGVAYDNGTGNPIHIGDTSAAGATAHATAGNKALAVSVFKPAVAEATDLAGEAPRSRSVSPRPRQRSPPDRIDRTTASSR